MPIHPDKTFSRIWRLTEQFAPLDPIRRADGDAELDDFAAAMNEVSQRLLTIEAGYFYPSGNLILNPEFAANTVGYAGAPLPLLAYGHNRWRSQAEGTVYTVTDGACTITVGAIGQLIDGRSIVTGPYTIMWEGDATCMIGGEPVEKGEVLYLVGGLDVEVLFSNGTVAFPQIAIGSMPLPFRPRPYEQELVLCRRFVFLEREEAITGTHIHESIVSVFAWSAGGVAAGAPRHFIRSIVEPSVSPRYQSLDGAWWGYVLQSGGGGIDYTEVIDGLSAAVTRHEGAIFDLETGTVTYQSVNNARVQAIEDDFTAAAASISELTLQAGPTGALATRLDQIEASYITMSDAEGAADAVRTEATALVAAESTARATAVDALATRLDTVEASYVVQADIDEAVQSSATAVVSSLSSAFADADAALAGRLDTIEASYITTGAVNAAISAAVGVEAQARADADAALATQVTTVQSQYQIILDSIDALDGDFGEVLATVNAAVAVEAQARSDADAALAAQITTIQSAYATSADLTAGLAAKGAVIYAATAPTSAAERTALNIWIDTGGSPARNRPHRWNGTAWVAVADADIAAAMAEAATKGRVIYAATAPTSAADRQTQNLWIDTGGSPARNEPHRWNGTAWVKLEPASLVQAKADISTLQATKATPAEAEAISNARIAASLATGGGIAAAIRDQGEALWLAAGNLIRTPVFSAAGRGEWTSGTVVEVAGQAPYTHALVITSAATNSDIVTLGDPNGIVLRVRGRARTADGNRALTLQVQRINASGALISAQTTILVAAGQDWTDFDLPITLGTAAGATGWRLRLSNTGTGAVDLRVLWLRVEDITRTQAVLTEATALVNAEATARATADNAMASQVQTIQATYATNAALATKGRVIYAATAPTSADDRQTVNLWIDTGGTPPRNRPHRWNGAAWVAVQDGQISTIQSAVTTQASAIAGLEEREASYKITANAGVPGGLEIVSTETGSKARLFASEILLEASVIRQMIGGEAVDLARIEQNALTTTSAGGAGEYAENGPAAWIDYFAIPVFCAARGAWAKAALRLDYLGRGRIWQVQLTRADSVVDLRQVVGVPPHLDEFGQAFNNTQTFMEVGFQLTPGVNTFTVRLWRAGGNARRVNFGQLWVTVNNN